MSVINFEKIIRCKYLYYSIIISFFRCFVTHNKSNNRNIFSVLSISVPRATNLQRFFYGSCIFRIITNELIGDNFWGLYYAFIFFFTTLSSKSHYKKMKKWKEFFGLLFHFCNLRRSCFDAFFFIYAFELQEMV